MLIEGRNDVPLQEAGRFGGALGFAGGLADGSLGGPDAERRRPGLAFGGGWGGSGRSAAGSTPGPAGAGTTASFLQTEQRTFRPTWFSGALRA